MTKFIELTYTDDTKVYINSKYIIAIDTTENSDTKVHFSGISSDYILVKELPEHIMSCIL